MLMVVVGSLFQEAGATKHSLAFNHTPQKVVFFSCLEKRSVSSHHNSTGLVSLLAFFSTLGGHTTLQT